MKTNTDELVEQMRAMRLEDPEMYQVIIAWCYRVMGHRQRKATAS